MCRTSVIHFVPSEADDNWVRTTVFSFWTFCFVILFLFIFFFRFDGQSEGFSLSLSIFDDTNDQVPFLCVHTNDDPVSECRFDEEPSLRHPFDPAYQSKYAQKPIDV